MEIKIDGVLCTNVADFAEKHNHSAATVAGWLDKAKESDKQVLKDVKPFGRIGNSNLYAESDLDLVKAEFGRTAKPKPVDREQYESVVLDNIRLSTENVELKASLIEAEAWLEYGKKQYAELSEKYETLQESYKIAMVDVERYESGHHN